MANSPAPLPSEQQVWFQFLAGQIAATGGSDPFSKGYAKWLTAQLGAAYGVTQ